MATSPMYFYGHYTSQQWTKDIWNAKHYIKMEEAESEIALGEIDGDFFEIITVYITN